MKGVIIYKSKYGATSQYAQWLSEELKLPARQPDEISSQEIADCDFIILGSSVYIGKLLIRNWLKAHMDILQNKKLFIFIVCGTPPAEKEKLNMIVKSSIELSKLTQSSIYFLHGKMLMKELHWTDRFLLKMGASLEKDPNTKKEMLTNFNDVKKEHLAALMQEVNAFTFRLA